MWWSKHDNVRINWTEVTSDAHCKKQEEKRIIFQVMENSTEFLYWRAKHSYFGVGLCYSASEKYFITKATAS